MKKIVLIIILCLAIPVTVVCQTFHAIIFANTNNESIGKSVTVDFKRMELEMTTIAKSIGYRLKKYNYYGGTENFNRKNLDIVLSDLSCSPDDIVFFYYSGHGGRAMNEKTDFPEMCLFVNDNDFISNSQLYPLYNVYSRINQKNPRLTIVMGDLCNSIIEGYYRKDDNMSKGATILSKSTCNVYKNLFLNTKGGLILASSEPEYTSGCYIYKHNGQWYHAGGYLTHSFLGMLQYFVSESKDISWKDFMDNTIGLTEELSKTDVNGNSRIPQTPIYKLNITPIQQISDNANIISPPQTPLASNDAVTNQRDEIAYSLSMVCNQSVPRLDRIYNIPKAQKHFESTQSKVQVIGFDNKTIVNTCSAESYLNYLSMATNMDQVVVLETKKNNSGKVTYIKVHEIHYQ